MVSHGCLCFIKSVKKFYSVPYVNALGCGFLKLFHGDVINITESTYGLDKEIDMNY